MVHQQPISTTELFPPTQVQKPEYTPTSFTPDVNHEVTLTKRTECFAYVFMLPIPFFCAGCCMRQAKCLDLVFNMQKETVFISEWRPYSILCPTTKLWEFSDIATVAYSSTSKQLDNGTTITTYFPCIIMKDRSFYSICDSSQFLHTELAHVILGLHRLIFDRKGASYQVPPLSSLEFTEPSSCC
jgi:hypothetical protein